MVQKTLVNGDNHLVLPFLREFDKIYPIDVAFELAQSEDHDRILYIASSKLNSSELHEAYSTVVALVRKLEVLDPKYRDYFGPFSVRLVSSDDEMAKAAKTHLLQSHSPNGAVISGVRLGNTYVDEGVIYPAINNSDSQILSSNSEFKDRILDGLGILSGRVVPEADIPKLLADKTLVRKLGRATRITSGYISSINVNVSVKIPSDLVTLDPLIAIRHTTGYQPFADRGDMGSIVVVPTGVHDPDTGLELLDSLGVIFAITSHNYSPSNPHTTYVIPFHDPAAITHF
jgi:hypothetical protein